MWLCMTPLVGATYSDRRSSWSKRERTTGVGSIQRKMVIGLVCRRSVSASGWHMTYSSSRWTVSGSGGVSPSKHRLDTSSMKNMLHRSLYPLYRPVASLWQSCDIGVTFMWHLSDISETTAWHLWDSHVMPVWYQYNI